MHLQVQLVHAGGGRLVVLVTGWDGDRCLGSALGEAAGAEEAEDRALARLQQRLANFPAQRPQPDPYQGNLQAPIQIPAQVPAQVPVPVAVPVESPAPLHAPIQAPTAPPKESPSPLPERPSPKEPSLPGAQPKPARPQGPASPFPAALTAKPSPGPGQAGSQAPAPARPRPLGASETTAAAPRDPGDQGAAGHSAGETAQLTLGSNASAEPASARSAPARAETAAELPADPEDWSDELAALELQLQRLGWQREQESVYLQRAFGHPSRSRLTSYGDLVAYLAAVRQFQAPADPASVAVPLRRVDLLAQSDQLLSQLGWDAARGREALESHFQRSSRQQLNDDDLLRFNMILEGELITGP